MNKRILLLKHLYQEELDAETLKALLADPELAEEFAHLEEMRHVLASGMGRVLPKAPEEAVLRIMQAAELPPRRPVTGQMRLPKRRIVWLAGAFSAVTAVFVMLMLFGSEPIEEQADLLTDQQQSEEVRSDTTLTWDDTEDLIEIRRSISVLHERTSPQLWDESTIMTLDSVLHNPAAALPYLQSASTTRRNQ